ncbi:hypothetical protein IAR55_004687 [Kwoniella newhampshirensis]|uniref:Xylanolytic transcriptional activator regulatory domain-containing protein n=1 Tax=Kwoniella newhampshirensis TaxID=1651941 RepID=A0AAW0YY59_9TREE
MLTLLPIGAIAELQAENEEQKRQIEVLQQQLDNAISAQFMSSTPAIVQHVIPPPPPALSTGSTTIAEIFVFQLLKVEIDLDAASQLLVTSIARQFGFTLPSVPVHTSRPTLPDTPGKVPLYRPDRQQAELMIETLQLLYPEGSDPNLDKIDGARPDVRIYRLYIIFAIGASLLPKDPDNPNTAQLRAIALAHFPAALRADDITCLCCVMLFAIYTMTDSAPMDPLHTVRMTAGLAVELGYLQDHLALPWKAREMRKRIFWSIYCMDRSVSSTMNHLPVIQEDAIQITLPSTVPELAGRHTTFMDPVTMFRQTVLLRRLQGLVSSELHFPTTNSSEEAEKTFVRIRNEIDTWYDDLPASYPSATWSACKHPYLVVNYHLLLVRLYSPSPLMPRPTHAGLSVLRQSAFRVIEMYGAGHEGYRMRQNFITVSHIVLACTALVYTLTEGEGDPLHWGLRKWRLSALQQIEAAQKLLANFCCHLTYATRYTEAFAQLTSDLQSRLREVDPVEPQSSWLAADQATSISSDSSLEPALRVDLTTQTIESSDQRLGQNTTINEFSVDDFLASFDLGSFPA